MNVIADDYDRSINEAIKITKYDIHLNLYLSRPVLDLFVFKWANSIMVICTHGTKICPFSDRNRRPQNYLGET